MHSLNTASDAGKKKLVRDWWLNLSEVILVSLIMKNSTYGFFIFAQVAKVMATEIQ